MTDKQTVQENAQAKTTQKANNKKHSKTKIPCSVTSYDAPELGNEMGLLYNAPEPTRDRGLIRGPKAQERSLRRDQRGDLWKECAPTLLTSRPHSGVRGEVASQICKITRNSEKIKLTAVEGH